jgi:anti-anti-sigma regulatory factor
MLRITSEKHQDSVRLTLEGSLTGPWVNELEREWRAIQSARAIPVVVDLTGVTFVGEDGKALLKQLWREGAQLIATGCCIGHLVEDIARSQPDMSCIRRGTE